MKLYLDATLKNIFIRLEIYSPEFLSESGCEAPIPGVDGSNALVLTTISMKESSSVAPLIGRRSVMLIDFPYFDKSKSDTPTRVLFEFGSP